MFNTVKRIKSAPVPHAQLSKPGDLKVGHLVDPSYNKTILTFQSPPVAYGSYSKFYVGFLHDGHEPVPVGIKVLYSKDSHRLTKNKQRWIATTPIESFLNELDIMRQIDAPCAVIGQILEDAKGRWYMIMPLMRATIIGASHVLKSYQPDLAIFTVAMMQQVASVLKRCHERDLIHGDVKPDNILLQQKNIALIDFGLSVGTAEINKTRQIRGTPAYLAPEFLDTDTHIGDKADIWSLGITILCILSAKPSCMHIEDLRHKSFLEFKEKYKKHHVLFEQMRIALKTAVYTNSPLRLDLIYGKDQPDYSFRLYMQEFILAAAAVNVKLTLFCLNHLLVKNPEDRMSAAEILDYLSKDDYPQFLKIWQYSDLSEAIVQTIEANHSFYKEEAYDIRALKILKQVLQPITT